MEIFMNKTDWIEYFEAIQSRTPTEIEIKAALEAGDFFEIEEEKIVERTAPASFQEKEGELIQKLKDNKTAANVTQLASNYFKWTLTTLKRPLTQDSGFNALNSGLTLGILVFFVSLSLTLNLHAFYEKTVVNSGLSSIGSFVGISQKNPIGFGMFISLLFAVALFFITFIFATWVALKVLKSSLTFLAVIDKYTSLFIPATFLIVIATILSLIRLNTISYIVLVVALSIVSIALYYVILTEKSNLRIDDFYARLLALITSSAILFVITFILTVIFTTVIFKSAFTM